MENDQKTYYHIECKNSFHRQCLEEWDISRTAKCPKCQEPMNLFNIYDQCRGVEDLPEDVQSAFDREMGEYLWPVLRPGYQPEDDSTTDENANEQEDVNVEPGAAEPGVPEAENVEAENAEAEIADPENAGPGVPAVAAEPLNQGVAANDEEEEQGGDEPEEPIEPEEAQTISTRALSVYGVDETLLKYVTERADLRMTLGELQFGQNPGFLEQERYIERCLQADQKYHDEATRLCVSFINGTDYDRLHHQDLLSRRRYITQYRLFDDQGDQLMTQMHRREYQKDREALKLIQLKSDSGMRIALLGNQEEAAKACKDELKEARRSLEAARAADPQRELWRRDPPDPREVGMIQDPDTDTPSDTPWMGAI